MNFVSFRLNCYSNKENIRLNRYYWCLMSMFYVTSFVMFANTRLHVTSQRLDIRSTLIGIQCDLLCANCDF